TLVSPTELLARFGIATAFAVALVTAPATGQSPPPAPAGETERARANTERVVFEAFPEADAYRGIKREVKQHHRRQIEAKLPFKVHFNELGKHQLIVAFRGRRP